MNNDNNALIISMFLRNMINSSGKDCGGGTI
jgi:hypothetical protein